MNTPSSISSNAAAASGRQGPPVVEPLHCSAVLTHHWLVRRRGGEKVLEALCELLPDGPIYTLVHDPVGAGAGWPEVHTSFLQRIPGGRRHYAKLLPLMPLAARRMRLPPVDLVVCSDAAIAKAMRPDPRSKVVCYCHSPMRYVWDLAETYRASVPWLLRPFWRRTAARLRAADRRAAERVDLFVANSRHVADRIRRHYGRDSVVVHPPVDLPPAPATGTREDFYVCVGHHVPYKRLDLAVAACRRLNRKLIVIGNGPDAERLARECSGRRLVGRDAPAERASSLSGLRAAGHYSTTGVTVEFLGYQPDEVMQDHYRRARALLFPGEEDFGIVPVEAMAHGCPVIAYGVGGASETVVDGQTGVLFEEQTVESLAAAIERADSLTFDPVAMHAHTQRFSRERFLREMREVLHSALA
ncbi:MAG TPA: glycosyltransferase [Phycisphaerae bacterium]|nr:glycosyltransferase [Phycisphaerae bacterium]